MKIIYTINQLNKLVTALHQQKVISYPTEAVFGLGCDPDSEKAVNELLTLKNRSSQKGFIIIAANYMQLIKYINLSKLNHVERNRMFYSWPGPVTWVIPASVHTPNWLTGEYSSIAVRISAYEPVRRLCIAFGKPLISTSANLTGKIPVRHASAVYQELNKELPLMNIPVQGILNPSIIRNAINGEFIRQY